MNWKNYFLDLENDHYEGLKMYNFRIEELQRKLEWANKNGRNFETGNIKINEGKGKQNLELRNKLRKAEEIATTSEKLKSAKEETGELEKVYQEERRNAQKLRDELKKLDEEILNHKKEAKMLQVKVRELENMKKNESEDRRNPGENEIEWSMGEEIRKLKTALDVKINELKKFKDGYGNSKKEHERVKKKLNKEIEELQMKLQQDKVEENQNEDMKSQKNQNEVLSKWQGYVEEDLNNIIWRMEKIEDDLNMKMGCKSDLLQETKNLVKFMKLTLYKYNPEEGMKMVDDLSLQDIKKRMKVIKDQLRHTSSGGERYRSLVSEMEKLEKKEKNLENGEDFYQDDKINCKEEFNLGGLWVF